MNQVAYNKLVSFLWIIMHDCLHGVYVREKYSMLFSFYIPVYAKIYNFKRDEGLT